MITINNIECKEDFVSVDRSGHLCEWRGKILFLVLQKTVDMTHVGEYSGPLFDYDDGPLLIYQGQYV